MHGLGIAGIRTEQEREAALQGEVQESKEDARNADDTLQQWQAAYSEESRELDAQEAGEPMVVIWQDCTAKQGGRLLYNTTSM